MPIDFKALQDFFPEDAIEWRVQTAGEKQGRVWCIAVAYLTNRAIQQRLDEVVGPENWRNEFQPGPDGGVVCGISIYVSRDVVAPGTGEVTATRGEWVTKWDGAENTDVEGVKGGLSAAMKRAAVQWGIGRYLYELEETFGRVHDDGRFRGKTREGTSFRWDPPAIPAEYLPRQAAPAPAPATAPVAPVGEHEAMLEYVRTVGPRVGDMAEIRVNRKAHNLKEFVRENWQSIKEQPRVARAVVEAIEAATGKAFGQDEGK
ncbi:Rad52/Rad22 family DNA repair protein [Longimicrobium sp.]|jgi:hypothetical protein|uniref:Rad52/Rad22 family DNA repair protein n=1 Tax=Longimicrobium sp. TaxID=2029185 RepID=UPI002F93E5FA